MSAPGLYRFRWLLIAAAPVLVPVGVAVWLVWLVLTIPQQLLACGLGLRGHQRAAAWLWNRSAMVVFDRERNLG